MKKITQFLSLITITLMIACGSSDTKPATETPKEKEVNAVNTTSVLEFEDINTLASKSSFSADEFSRVTTFLSGKEITLVGYPNAYPGSKEVEFKINYTSMIDAIDNSLKNIEVSIKFKETGENVMLSAGVLFAVTGKIDIGYTVDEKWGNKMYITIYDASFVETDESKQTAFTSISELDLSKQINISNIYQLMHTHYENLFNKSTIEIVDNYSHTLTSTTSYGTHYNVVLGKENLVHCFTTDEPNSEDLNAKRNAGEPIKIIGNFGGCSQTATLKHSTIQ